MLLSWEGEGPSQRCFVEPRNIGALGALGPQRIRAIVFTEILAQLAVDSGQARDFDNDAVPNQAMYVYVVHCCAL